MADRQTELASPHTTHHSSTQPTSFSIDSLLRVTTQHKSKRFRTSFTPQQLAVLEAEFGVSQYMVGERRERLAHSLALTVAQVKVWFQNRRIRFRRDLRAALQKQNK